MIKCSKCETVLPTELLTAIETVECPGCAAKTRVEVFPRLMRPVEEGRLAESVLGDEDASCFFHPENRAEVPCDGCGRYLCSVCDLELEGRHICSTCLESGHGLEREDRFVRERVLWGSIVLSLSLLPLLIFYFTIVTAPLAICLAVVHRKSPGSLVRSGRVKLVLGSIIAGLQIIGWMALLGVVVVSLVAA